MQLQDTLRRFDISAQDLSVLSRDRVVEPFCQNVQILVWRVTVSG